MFCPRCGIDNKLDQSYCRQCGLSLPAVRLALEGRVDQAIKTLEKGQNLLRDSVILLVVFCLIALFGLATGKLAEFIRQYETFFWLAAALPLFVLGIRRFRHALHLLKPHDQAEQLPSEGSETLLSGGDQASLPISKQPPLVSVAENTTLPLEAKQAGQTRVE